MRCFAADLCQSLLSFYERCNKVGAEGWEEVRETSEQNDGKKKLHV